jgi:hypothetical protein
MAAKKKTETKEIKLPELEIQRLSLRVVGITPLLTHRWSEKALTQMRATQQKTAKMAKEAKNPEADFEGAKYRDENGRECVRSIFFKNAIVSAARYADDLKMTVLRGALFIEGDFLPIQDKSGKKAAKSVMREDTVRVGMGKADLRYRPEYTDWSVDITVQFNSHVLSAEQVINLVRLAGFSVGICEWRPERNGHYGRFDVEAIAGKARKAA